MGKGQCLDCKECGGKGWIDSHISKDAAFRTVLMQCKNKCNVLGYSNEVQVRGGYTIDPVSMIQNFGQGATLGKVIPFRRSK